ncbi:MAG TPA: hypothetical protein VHD33_00165, partial [Legionellaceae bacterium]|nr:hypothetical protein [Legionellaceae bacterium]
LYDGAVVITPNNRLSQQILQAYDLKYRAEKRIVPKPLCYPYITFLHTLFQKILYQQPYQHHPIVLSTQQAHHLWQSILIQHHTTLSKGLLNAVYTAWEYCQAWHISPQDTSFHSTAYTRQFQIWFKEYHRALNTRHAITTQQIPTYIMENSLLMDHTTIIWTCFDELTPIQKSLEAYFTQYQCPSFQDDLVPKSTATYCFAAQDQLDEYQLMLEWIKTRLNLGDQRIAIVVPELQRDAPMLQRLFEQHFLSEYYNISYGRTLNEYPIIGTALECLALDLQQVTTGQMHLLLQSPFLKAGQQEFSARSQLLQDNPWIHSPILPWVKFLAYTAGKTPQLHSILQDLTPYPENDSPQGWVMHFRERLERLGFPGEGPILSPLYQSFQRFILLLDEFMSLAIVTPDMSAKDAIQALRELSQTIIFQTKKPSSPITVLGMLEASGCQFDSMWVTGISDQCLPQKPKFSPLLAITLQKTSLMPHTCAQREFIRAKKALERFAFGCQHTIVYSYPKIIGDQPQLPSFLIKDLPHLVIPPL